MSGVEAILAIRHHSPAPTKREVAVVELLLNGRSGGLGPDDGERAAGC